MKEIPETMLSGVAFGPGDVRLVEIPVPEPDDYEVLIRNEGCLFCNTTDRIIVEDGCYSPGYPIAFGHEDFGTVVKVGKKVKKYKLGDRVICGCGVKGFDGTYHSVWSGFSQYAIAGDWESYMADGGDTERENAYRRRYRHNLIIPNALSRQQAGLAFPLAETASAIRQVGDLQGKTVVVIGTGFVGYAFVMFAKLLGAQKVICLGRRQERLAVAEKLGADLCFTDVAEAAEGILALGGADVVLEASGNHRAVEKGLPYLKENGIFAMYGIPQQPYLMDKEKCPTCFRQFRIDPETEKGMAFVCKALLEGTIPVDVFLTHQWTLAQMPEGYKAVCRGEVIKGLVHMYPEETV